MAKAEKTFELFNFEKREIVSLINRELKVIKRANKSFDYVFNKLKSMKHIVSGKTIKIPEPNFYGKIKSKWLEGKNYHWLAIESTSVKLLIRKYHTHFTIFQCLEETVTIRNDKYTEKKYGAFYFHIDTDLIDHDDQELRKNPDFDGYKYLGDFFMENSTYDLNNYINAIIEHTKKRMGSMWIVEREGEKHLPKRIKINDVFDGHEHITDIEKMIFCCEELSNIEMGLFSENEMVEKIKTFKVGQMLGAYKITKINTNIVDEYYHNVGMELLNTNFPDKKSEWKDVYSLTSYYFKNVFPIEKKKELTTKETEILVEHYRGIAIKMLEETKDKKDLTHIKEAMRNMPQGFDKTWLFASLITEENKAKE